MATSPSHAMLFSDEAISLTQAQVNESFGEAQLQKELEAQLVESIHATAYRSHVSPVGAETTEPIKANNEGAYTLHSVEQVGLPAIGPSSDTEYVEQVIEVTGRAPAGATAIIRLADGRRSFQVAADTKGEWAVHIPTATIPAGEHQGTVQLISQGVASPRIPFAQFSVAHIRTATPQTWSFLAVAGSLIILLLLAINVCLLRERHHEIMNAPDLSLFNEDRLGGYHDDKLITRIAEATNADSLKIYTH